MAKIKNNESQLRTVVENVVENYVSNQFVPLFEGIDFNTYNNTVRFTDEHEDNVDTSLENNPTLSRTTVRGINVWSLFKRKHTPIGGGQDLDGNPVINAMKHIDGWHFISKENEIKFMQRIGEVVDKFLSIYKTGITVVVPSGGDINKILSDMIQMKAPQATVIDDVMRKLTVQEVWEDLSQLDSPFRKQHGRTPIEWRQTEIAMMDAMKKMKAYRKGYFTYHYTPDEYRNAITTTLAKNDLTCAKYVPLFDSQNILIIDDTISRANTIRNACNIINDFAPNSITVLTLFSKKYPSI